MVSVPHVWSDGNPVITESSDTPPDVEKVRVPIVNEIPGIRQYQRAG
ncbi:MAG TPA: hypothetical protein VE152_12235 [Acidimicrobiales bacterium]|jgi:hypothetical protein|nr:hypothetical protein [Acidimicrobiales bacterium]